MPSKEAQKVMKKQGFELINGVFVQDMTGKMTPTDKEELAARVATNGSKTRYGKEIIVTKNGALRGGRVKK